MTEEKKWYGQINCDICGLEIEAAGDTCYDACTASGPWAFMCKPCYMHIGLAVGQEYNAKTLIKIRDLS